MLLEHAADGIAHGVVLVQRALELPAERARLCLAHGFLGRERPLHRLVSSSRAQPLEGIARRIAIPCRTDLVGGYVAPGQWELGDEHDGSTLAPPVDSRL